MQIAKLPVNQSDNFIDWLLFSGNSLCLKGLCEKQTIITNNPYTYKILLTNLYLSRLFQNFFKTYCFTKITLFLG